MPLRKAIGERGSWFATVGDERLPCVHKYFYKKGRYEAPRAWQHDPKHIELVDAIRKLGKVILTEDRVLGDGEGFERMGYIAVWRVSDVVWDNDVLRFRFDERLEDLR